MRSGDSMGLAWIDCGRDRAGGNDGAEIGKCKDRRLEDLRGDILPAFGGKYDVVGEVPILSLGKGLIESPSNIIFSLIGLTNVRLLEDIRRGIGDSSVITSLSSSLRLPSSSRLIIFLVGVEGVVGAGSGGGELVVESNTAARNCSC
jgi:hypothetical protein